MSAAESEVDGKEGAGSQYSRRARGRLPAFRWRDLAIYGTPLHQRGLLSRLVATRRQPELRLDCRRGQLVPAAQQRSFDLAIQRQALQPEWLRWLEIDNSGLTVPLGR